MPDAPSDNSAPRLVSLAPLTTGLSDNVEAIRSAHETGYSAVGLHLPRDLEDKPGARFEPGNAARLRHELARLNLRALDACCLNLTFDAGCEPLRGRQRAAVRWAGAVGCRLVVVVPWDTNLQRLMANLRRLADVAREHNTGLGLEFMQYCSVPNLPAAAEITAELNDPVVQIIVDALHLDRSGGSVDDLQDVDPQIVGELQICDARATPPSADRLRDEALGDRLLPGTGSLALKRLIAAMPAQMPVSLECPCVDLAPKPPNTRASAVRAAFATL